MLPDDGKIAGSEELVAKSEGVVAGEPVENGAQPEAMVQDALPNEASTLSQEVQSADANVVPNTEPVQDSPTIPVVPERLAESDADLDSANIGSASVPSEIAQTVAPEAAPEVSPKVVPVPETPKEPVAEVTSNVNVDEIAGAIDPMKIATALINEKGSEHLASGALDFDTRIREAREANDSGGQ